MTTSDDSFDDESILAAISTSNRILYHHWAAIFIKLLNNTYIMCSLLYKFPVLYTDSHMSFHVLYITAKVYYGAIVIIQKWEYLYYMNTIAYIALNVS